MTMKFQVNFDRNSSLWKELFEGIVDALSQIEQRGGGLQKAKQVTIEIPLPTKENALSVRRAFLQAVDK